jgi:PAS domain S-box-containing protein
MSLRILIVEDDATFRKVLTLLFDEHWTVDAAPDAETALEMVAAHRPDLALLDFRLPGMDGLELARRLRAREETREVPVVMLSGVATEPVRVRALTEGVRDFLIKPVSESELKARVDALVGTAEAHRRDMAEARRRLRESEERFQLLLAAVTDHAIVMLDPRGRVASWNAGAQRISGYAEPEVVGQPLSILHAPGEEVSTEALLAEARERGRAEHEGWRVRKDGTRFWANTILSPVRDEDGTLRGFAEVTSDLTERKRAEDECARLLQEAEAANRGKEQFLALLSHELRTPLNAILGWTHLLRAGGLDSTMTARALEIVERNASLQSRLVDEILDLSALLSGRVSLARAPVDLAQPVEMAVESARPAAEAKGLRLDADLPSAGPVDGDALRLQQVASCLIANAIKFTPGGGRVEVRVGADGAEAVLAVSDTGVGFAPEFQARIFKPFEQADPSSTRRHGGLGLGLAMAHRIVGLHEGSIEATSEPGVGTTVTVRLPLISRRP